MTHDGTISTIFNPHGRNRTSSIFITNDNMTPGILTNGDTTLSNYQDAEGGNLPIPCVHGINSRSKTCYSIFCSTSTKKIYFGVWVMMCVTASWIGATHCVKYIYLRNILHKRQNLEDRHASDFLGLNITTPTQTSFDAPFFTTWFITNWTVLFFPLYLLGRWSSSHRMVVSEVLCENLRAFRDRGFTIGKFLTRCSLFCLLWVVTNYMYILSLRILLATDVMALFSTNVSFVYLLSWVILHEQFVGIRIMAVIICDTGVALLAYMDGITDSPTLGGVVLAASAAAGSAIYKVLFKKVMGDASYGQVAFFFSLIGLLNAIMLWPFCVGLYLSGIESISLEALPWSLLISAGALSLVANLLGNFSVAFTYDVFITLGLITSVPISAALDVLLYDAKFEGMKLSGMILIAVGFFLVMFPYNWPDYITRLLRNIIILTHSASIPTPNKAKKVKMIWGKSRLRAIGNQRRDVIDYRTGYIRSHLRSPSGRVR